MSRGRSVLEAWPLRRKLWLGFAGVLLVALGLGLQGLESRRELQGRLDELHAKHLVGIGAIKRAQVHFSQLGQPAGRLARSVDPGEQSRIRARLDLADALVERDIGEVDRTLILAENRRLHEGYQRDQAQFRENIRQLLVMLERGDTESARAWVASERYGTPALAADAALERMAQLKEEDSAASVARARAEAEANARFTVQLIAGALLFGALLALVIDRSIARRMCSR